jgi:hypothetical protein
LHFWKEKKMLEKTNRNRNRNKKRKRKRKRKKKKDEVIVLTWVLILRGHLRMLLLQRDNWSRS